MINNILGIDQLQDIEIQQRKKAEAFIHFEKVKQITLKEYKKSELIDYWYERWILPRIERLNI